MPAWEYTAVYLETARGRHAAMHDNLRAAFGAPAETLEERIEKPLNDFGRAGWELVAVMPGEEGYIGILKRPTETPSEPRP